MRPIHLFRTVCLTVALSLVAGLAQAQPDFTRKERKGCNVCHDGGWKTGRLTEAGEYFVAKRTLRNFVPKTALPVRQTPL